MRQCFCCNVQGKAFVENKERTRQLLTDKEVRYKTVKYDICDYSTNGITSYTHHKKIHYTPEKNNLTVLNVAKGLEFFFIYINTIRPPVKTK